MKTFVIIYSGGVIPQTQEEIAVVMEAWKEWLGRMKGSVVSGDLFGHFLTITQNGITEEIKPAIDLVGYSLLQAESFSDVTEKCENHPHLSQGGEILIFDTFPMGLT